MTETAKQDFSPEEIENDDIASDDPLFELSRIIGFDDEAPASVAVDPQIDLEEALMAEMAAPAPQPDFEPAPSEEIDLEPEASIEVQAPVAVDAAYEEPEFEEPRIAETDFEPENELQDFDVQAQPDTAFDSANSFDDELTIEPETFAEAETLSAPTPESLEDELAAMLGGDVAVATEVADLENMLPDAEAEHPAADIPDVEQSFAAPEETYVEPAFEEIAEIETVAEQPTAPMSYATPLAPEPEIAPDYVDEIDAPVEVTEDYASAEVALPESAPVDASTVDGDADLDIALDDNFAAFFDEDLPAFDEDLPAEEASRFDAGVNDAAAILEADIAAQAPHSVAEAPAKPMADAAAPILETADMSGFEANDAAAFDVPDLPDLDTDFAASFDENFTADTVDDQSSEAGIGVAAAAAAVAAGAGTLARRAGETAMTNDDDAFDESRFEAELARDMEFVSHDLNADAGHNDQSLDSGFENQEFAMAAADAKPAKRGLVIAAVLGCVAIAGAIGVFAFSGSQTTGADGPVLVEASTDPVKIAPTDPGGKQVPNQDRAVFNETTAAPAQEALGTTSEEPVDIASVPESALPSDLSSADTQKGDARLLPEDTAAASNDTSAIVAPRRVRTLVVKPDGTLVERAVVPTPEPVAPVPVAEASTETAAAPAAPAANEGVTFNAPTAPAAAENTNASEPVVVPEPAPADVAAQPAETVVPEAEPATAEATPAAPAAPARTVATQKIVAPSQIAERPKDQPVTVVNGEATQVAAAPAAAPTPAPAPAPAAAAPSTFVVQVSSQPSQELAQRSASNFSRQFGNVIGNRGVTIQRAVIDGRGTFYRVRINSESRADANALCGRIKSSGGDCFVTR